MLTLVVWLCTLWYKEVFYLLEHSLIANKSQGVCVNCFSSDVFAKIGQAICTIWPNLIYYGVNSIIIYKLRYYSIYLT